MFKVSDIKRTLRLLIRHIRYFQIWEKENSSKLTVLKTLFKVINSFLMDICVEYWLSYGTLLGYYRNREIITYDKDVDFGTHEKEFNKIWNCRHKLPDSFTMHDTTYRHRGPKLYISYKGWEADIYFYEDLGSDIRSYEISKNPREMMSFPKNYIYPLQEASFLEEKTFIPNQTEVYLLHIYGYIGEDAKQDKKTGLWYPKK